MDDRLKMPKLYMTPLSKDEIACILDQWSRLWLNIDRRKIVLQYFGFCTSQSIEPTFEHFLGYLIEEIFG